MQSNIFFFTSTLSGGGAERVITTLASNISKSKIITLYDNPSQYTCNIIYQSLSRYSSNKLVRLLKLPISLIKYCILTNAESPSICVGALPVDNLINILSSIITGIPAIISVHGMPSHNYSNLDKMTKSIVFFLTKKTKTQVIAVSNGVQDELIHLYGLSESQISVIYNPIDVPTIQKLSKEEELDARVNTNVPLIITVGRLNAVKGQWHLIRAFAELRKKQECQLLICGEGPEKEYLYGLIRDLGIEDDVVFLGWQENPYKYMKRSTVFVQSSLSEALPNVLVESMACGCPVVAAGCSPGIEEILGTNNKCGFIVRKMSGRKYKVNEPIDDGERDLYNNLLKILENLELREKMALECKERSKLFDVQIGIKKYFELIEKISNNTNPHT